MRKRLASLKYFADILIDFGFSTGFEPAMISMARTSPRKLSSSSSVSFWSAEKFKSVGSISPHLMFLTIGAIGASDTGEIATGASRTSRRTRFGHFDACERSDSEKFILD